MQQKFNNIEKKLSGGGANTPPLDMQQFIKLADKEKIEYDALNEKLELLKDAWIKQREPGETYNSWFKRLSREEIIRLTLGSGGKVIKFPTDLAKSKEPKIQSITLGQYFDLGRTLSSLSKSELDTVKYLLNKTLNPKK